MSNYLEKQEELLKECETLLQLGKRDLADKITVQLLDGLKKRPRLFPRNLKPIFAGFLRRLGKSQIALKVLYPLVNPRLKMMKTLNPSKDLSASNVEELEEYSAALINLRAEEQAQMILQTLTPLNSPKTQLFLGMLNMNRWDYENACFHLNKFEQMKKPSSLQYLHYIGVVNLMASKVSLLDEVHFKPEDVIAEIENYLTITKNKKFLVLYANLLEIKTQALFKANLKLGNNIEGAKRILKDQDSRDSLYIKKWKTLSQMPNKKSSPSTKKIQAFIEDLNQVRIQANAIHDYETLRDLDFYQSNFQEDLLDKVFYGTPSKNFRARIDSSKINDHYWYDLNPKGSSKKKEIDYLTYPDLKPGSLIYRTLFGLTVDFYRPHTLLSLFEVLFPSEFFNPLSSPNKIHQALNRTKIWLKENKIPLSIYEENNRYYLRGDCFLKIYFHERFSNSIDPKNLDIFLKFETLKKNSNDQKLKAKEVMEILNLPNIRATQRLIEDFLELKLLKKSGYRKGAIYYIL